MNGPLEIQGEFIDAIVGEAGGQTESFSGFYLYAGWFLTGESRPYDPAAGDFKRLIPRRNFDFGRRGAWGAIELACRYSYTDLTDGNVQGGRLSLLMTDLNWYLQPHLRWMFNLGIGDVSGTAQDGQMLIFQTRIGVDF